MDSFLYILAKVTGFLARLLPPGIALRIGRILGILAYWFGKRRRTIAYKNLHLVMGSSHSHQEILSIIKGMFQNTGMSLIEVLRFPRIDDDYVKKYIRIEGIEWIQRGLSKGKGVILLTAHFGNWEMCALCSAIRGYSLKVIVKTQKFRRLNNLLNHYRKIRGCEVVSKGMGIRQVIKSLRSNEIVGILADQHGGSRGVQVELFGRRVSTPVGPVFFALKTGCEVLPAFIIRENGAHHRIIVGEPLDLEWSGDTQTDFVTNLRKFHRILESYVLRFPEQWLWMHNRWKLAELKRN
jgi:KDO2-lipid IV(A) lauroyltransferase